MTASEQTGQKHTTLSIRFINSVDWRTDPVRRTESLNSYSDLVKWAKEAGIVSDSISRKLLKRATHEPRAAENVLQRSMALRDALYRVLSASVAGHQPQPADMDRVNSAIADSARYMRLTGGNHGAFYWDWHGDDDALDRMLWPIVRSATNLLTSADFDRLRECEGEGCGWLFLDTTRNHSRRWCSMQSCGNRAKVHRFYQRHKSRNSS